LRIRFVVTESSPASVTVERLRTDLIVAGAEIVADRAEAVVFFPDEGGTEEVFRELYRLRREAPRVLAVVITRCPHRFDGDSLGGGPAPLVIQRPVSATTLLSRIADHRR
jgi:hypothetical protein